MQSLFRAIPPPPTPPRDYTPVGNMDTWESTPTGGYDSSSTTLDGDVSEVSQESSVKRSIRHVNTNPEDDPHTKRQVLDGGANQTFESECGDYFICDSCVRLSDVYSFRPAVPYLAPGRPSPCVYSCPLSVYSCPLAVYSCPLAFSCCCAPFSFPFRFKTTPLEWRA